MVSSAGREAVDLAAQCGLILDAHQCLVLEGALAERADGRWAAFEVGVIEPRQNGKGSILEARELAGMFLFGEQMLLHSAHEFKTAEEAFRRIRFLIESNPDLERRVLKIRTANGSESIELRNGSRLRFVARTAGSGRGFSGDLVILDEAYNLPAQAMAALVPTLSARPNPQIWYTSSAPLQTQESAVLRDFCRRGRASTGGRLAYFEWCADPDDDPSDPQVWAKANPALGSRISVEFVENERAALGAEFGRERLGLWVDTEQVGEQVIDPAAWLACRDEKSGPVGPVCFALDVSPARTQAAFGVAGAAGSGGVHVEIVDYRPGTGWLVDRARELCDRWGGRLAVASGSPAASLMVDLEAAGVPVLEVSTADHAAACGRFFDRIHDQTLRHLGQLWLDDAVHGAARRPYGDAWLWARRQSAVDISPLVAATLAAWAYEQAPDPEVAVIDLTAL